MPIQTYQEALAFWFNRVNYEYRGMPADVRELKLDRMRALLDELGNPQDGLRIVHVAGSKGKGSTSAILASVLRHSGRRTGLFTSPHLTRVEERVQVDGENLPSTALLRLMQAIEPASEAVEARMGAPLTFFEIMTALGFLHFREQGVDAVVLEVGLGGRFDATNVCRPDVAVITSISLDHVRQLGNTLASIAFEKAGIIKPGVPVVSGATAPEARAVIERRAGEEAAELHQLGRDFDFEHQSGRLVGERLLPPSVRVRWPDRVTPWRRVNLLGEHQAANAAVATAVVDVLRRRGWRIDEEAVAGGLATVHWPGRMEILGHAPVIVLDCAHNVASAEAVVRTLDESFAKGGKRILVFAGSRDKDLEGMLAALMPVFDEAYFCRYASSPRGAPPEELLAVWRTLTPKPGRAVETSAAALAAARARAGPADLICILGSVFLAGELRPTLVAAT